MRSGRLRLNTPSRIDIGPFRSLEYLGSEAGEEVGLAEADRSPDEGWIWLVQRNPLRAGKAFTLPMRVVRPDREKAEECLVVLSCDGGSSGAGS